MLFLALLPIIAFFLLFLFLIARQPQPGDGPVEWQEALIQTALFWSAYLALGTELLSLFRALTTTGVAALWTSALLFLIVGHVRYKTFTKARSKLKAILKGVTFEWFDLSLLAVIFLTLIIILITAVMSPPNIHDVLTYHMSRVMYWVQNRALTFFPTSITWQLYYPPFSEFSQLHWQLLAGRDTLSAFHQWYSLVFILVAVVTIAKLIGVNRRGQLVSALFFVSLPIVVLQASGGKNDVVLTAFFMALAYYVVKAVYHPLGWMDYVSAGLAFALGVMTKGHFVIFSLPLLLWLLWSMLRNSGCRKTLVFAGIGLLSVLLLNGGHWVRNTLTFGDPTNTSEAGFIVNGRFGVDVLFSNLTRNTALQLSSVGRVNQVVEDQLAALHDVMGIPLFDLDTTLGPKAFYSNPTREEVAGNPIHFVITSFAFIAVIVLMLRRINHSQAKTALGLSLSAIVGMVFFSGVFRWQAWGTRYFIFYYALFAPVVGCLIGMLKPRWTSGLFAIVLILVMVNPLINNYSRSFSWSAENRNSIWRMSRRGLRFANHRIYEGAVLELTHLMEISGCRTYGMSIGGNSPEYLIWGTLTPDSRDYYLEHMDVENLSAVHATENFDPCGIIVLEAAPPKIALEGNYLLIGGWPLEGYEGLPLTLYMKPDVITW